MPLPSDEEVLPWHYFVFDPKQTVLWNNILCFRMNKTSPWMPDFAEGKEIVSITTAKEQVTCQDCLAWIHA